MYFFFIFCLDNREEMLYNDYEVSVRFIKLNNILVE